MNESTPDKSTDAAWEEWGQRDPYFGVITDPKFRRAAINEEAKREFFESGASHVDHVLKTIHRYIDPHFAPHKILDFGCGVGRLLPSLAAIADEVVGLDVSQSMLQEAQLNCDERQVRNIQLLRSDDDLSALSGTFDLIHSSIVFQHIPVVRGRAIFSNLLRHLRPGGVGAIHITYSKAHFAPTHGVAPAAAEFPAAATAPAEPIPADSESQRPGTTPAPPPTTPSSAASAPPVDADPDIQMNPYNMNEILFAMQSTGVQRWHAEFSDHGGELGVFLFFSVAGPALTSAI